MINLKPENIQEWDGFDVYSAKSGSYLTPAEVAEKSFPDDKRLAQIACGFCLDWEGFFNLMCDGSETVYVPREGYYLIQINGTKYMEW